MNINKKYLLQTVKVKKSLNVTEKNVCVNYFIFRTYKNVFWGSLWLFLINTSKRVNELYEEDIFHNKYVNVSWLKLIINLRVEIFTMKSWIKWIIPQWCTVPCNSHIFPNIHTFLNKEKSIISSYYTIFLNFFFCASNSPPTSS